MPKRSRSRSRSPDRHRSTHYEHHRTRSPDRSRHHERFRRNLHASIPSTAVILPLNAQPIQKHDLRKYRPMFALYLDIQKQLDIDSLEEDEVRGRWKSFVGKWNRGELAEGWYDPKTFEKAVAAEEQFAREDDKDVHHDHSTYKSREYDRRDSNVENTQRPSRDRDRDSETHGHDNTNNQVPDDGSDDDFGPSLPTTMTQTTTQSSNNTRSGPSIPSIQDLQARNEQTQEAQETAREQSYSLLRAQRKTDCALQTQRLDDLTPRAEPGTRERQLENKRLRADASRGFAAAAHEQGNVELRDSEVMGEEDGLAELKRMKKESERKKNEREIRREEVLRARIAEREERMMGMRAKEEKTMDMLRRLAEARFGSGSGSGGGGDE